MVRRVMMLGWLWCVGCGVSETQDAPLEDMPQDVSVPRDVSEMSEETSDMAVDMAADMPPDLPEKEDMAPLPTPCASWYPDEETRQAAAFSYGIRCGGCHGQEGEGTFFGPPILGVVARRGAEEVIRVMQEGEGRMQGLGTEQAEAEQIVTWMRCLSQE